jgi:hypothetical protein
MAGANLTTLSNILKEYYLPPVVEQLNNEVLIVQRLEARDQELFGKEAYVPIHTARSGGVGARGEYAGAANLPTAGNQSYNKAVFDLKYLYGSVLVTGPSMAKTASEAGSFLQALKSELDGIRNDLQIDVARQCYGDGTAQIAQCGTTTASNVVVLANSEALRKGFLYINQVVDIGTAASPASVASAVTITDLSVASGTITVSGSAVTTSASNFVFRSGSGINATSSFEMDGLQKLVTSGSANTVGGIDSSAAGNSFWQNLQDTSGGALALDKMMQNYNQVRIAGGNLSVVLSTFGLQRAFFNLLQSQVRYTEPQTIRGGFQVLEFQGMPFIADRLAPFGKVHWLDESYLKVFTNRDWHFLDEDGHILKWVPNADAWQAALARYMNLGISRRNVQLVQSGLTDTTGY